MPGRYHIVSVCRGYAPQAWARHTALAQHAPHRVTYLATAPTALTREWRVSTEDLPFDVVTLFEQPCELVPPAQRRAAAEEALQRLQPTDVFVLGYDDPAMRAAAACSRRRGARTYLYFETCEHDQRRSAVKEWVKRAILPRLFDGVFTGGMRHRDYASKLGFRAERIVTGYSVVDNEHFAQNAEAAQIEEEALRQELELPDRYFLYVGRFAPEKNLPTLFRAYERYRAEHSCHWGLVLVGSGDQEESLKALVRELDLRDVHWFPFQQLAHLPRFYGLASCFVLPSTREPWGLVINEAMASGLPVLVSERCGCVPDLVRPDVNGYTFDPGDAQSLAALMGKVSGKQADFESMGRASREIIANYTPQTWARSLLELIDRVTSVPTGRQGRGRSAT